MNAEELRLTLVDALEVLDKDTALIKSIKSDKDAAGQFIIITMFDGRVFEVIIKER